MKKTLFFAAALLSLAACNKAVIDSQMAEYGFLSFDVSADNTVKVETKAGADDEFTYDVSSFLVAFGGKEYPISELSSPVQIATGTYDIEAYNYTLADAEKGNGHLRIADSKQVTVTANAAATAVLRCTPKSSEVKLAYSENYKRLYPTSVFTLTGKRNNVDNVVLPLVENTPVYYNNTENGTVSVTYQIKAKGDASDKNTTFGGTLSLKNAHSLTITVDVQTANGQIAIDLKATNMLTNEFSTITVDPYSGNSSVANN